MAVPPARRRRLNDAPVDPAGDFVLYWMVAHRRTRWSFALERAVEWARELKKPLVVLEALGVRYEWASDRLHRFVLEGMAANARRLGSRPVTPYAYVEPRPGDGRGLLEALAKRAAVAVTDDAPVFFLPRMTEAAAAKLGVRLEAVDSNGLLPIAAADRAFHRAVDFRRFLQRHLPGHLLEMPQADPLARLRLPRLEALPPSILRRWPNLAARLAEGRFPDLARLPIDHGVAPVSLHGGAEAAGERLRSFLDERLARYQEGRLDLADPSTSGLSPYLHFGHVSPHQVFAELAEREGWDPGRLADPPARGQREGYWGMSANAEAFVDQLVTWRELGFNTARRGPDTERYESLPAWALGTLEKHAADPRGYVYDLADFEAARTHDELWNAAQRELLVDGTLPNYLRMLWGKKVLEWSPSPRAALDVMWELNNKYALDGRDPNSTSGIFWCLGRYDRAWGPERPIFGTVRYMSSESARRKLRLGSYLDRYGAQGKLPGT